jgi:hypothetical protein
MPTKLRIQTCNCMQVGPYSIPKDVEAGVRVPDVTMR